MRILTIAHNHLWKYRPHGGEISTRTVLEYLKKYGFEIYVIHNAPEDYGEFNGIRYWSIPAHKLKKFCDDKIKELRPDILLSWSKEGILTEFLSRKYGIPYIYFVHFWFLFVKPPNLRSLFVSPPTSWSLFVNSRYINLLEKPIDEEIIDKYLPIFKRARILIANSVFTSKVIKRYYNCKSLVSHPPVMPLNIYKTEKKFLTLINWSPIKGSMIVKKLAQQMPKQNFLGVGGSHLNCSLSRLSILRKSNITIIPYQNKMEKIYSNTRILLCPSIIDESFGMVALEALSLGIPVIAFRSGALPEVVGDGGIILEKGCPIREWEEAIRSITYNYKEFSKKAYSQSQNFNWRTEINKIMIEIIRSF